MPIDASSFNGDSIQTVRILNQPGAIFPANPGVQARDAISKYRYIVGRKTANSQYGFIQWLFPDDFPIYLDQHLGIV